MTPSPDSHGISKRKSAIKACLRCHRRKQRCIGYPACENCRAAGAQCHRESTATVRRLAGLSKEELMGMVERLESQKLNHEDQQRPASSPDQTLPPESTEASVQNHEEESENLAGTHALPVASPRQVAKAYTGGTVHNEFAHEDNNRSRALHDHPLLEAGTTTCNSSQSDHLWQQSQRDALPDEKLGLRLLTTYLESLYRRLPFCNFAMLLQTHKAIQEDDTHIATMDKFRLYMAYAIGASILSLTGGATSIQPSRYVSIASEIRGTLPRILLQDVEVLLWMLLFKLRSHFQSEVWYEIGLAMRTAIEAGMHRDNTYKDLVPEDKNLRRRLFWAVYVMERNVCWSLKRPFSIGDADIDTELPSPMVHPTTLGELPTLDTSILVDDVPHRPLDLRIFIATITLSRINSRTYTELYCVDRKPSTAQERVPALLEQLLQFELSIPPCNDADKEFLQLHTQNAVRILIEPFLSFMSPHDPLLKICLDACGRACQLFKVLRMKRSLGYAFTMVNSVFVAGTTICYILYKNPLLWTPSRANDIRACSSTLFAASERNDAVRKYCDVLDTIINATMEHVEHVSSPIVINCASASSHDEAGPGSPAEAFNKLEHTLKNLGFEFPSQSYPIYRTEATGIPRNAQNNDLSLLSPTPDALIDGYDPPFPIDFAFPEAQWGFAGGLNTMMGMSSGNHFIQDNYYT